MIPRSTRRTRNWPRTTPRRCCATSGQLRGGNWTRSVACGTDHQHRRFGHSSNALTTSYSRGRFWVKTATLGRLNTFPAPAQHRILPTTGRQILTSRKTESPTEIEGFLFVHVRFQEIFGGHRVLRAMLEAIWRLMPPRESFVRFDFAHWVKLKRPRLDTSAKTGYDTYQSV